MATEAKVQCSPLPWRFLPFDCTIVHDACDHGAEQIAWSDADYRLMVTGANCHAALLEACKRLLKFNEEICADVNISTHYPSADFARAAIAKAEGQE